MSAAFQKHRVAAGIGRFAMLLLVCLTTSAQTVLDNGVNPANLGKGDWIWQLPFCESSLSLAANDVQGVIDYEKAEGMQWITVKCGDGTIIYPQFNPDLISRAHNAGLKIFGYAYVYGSNDVSGEIAVALNALNLGADGFIIEAEDEYDNAGQKTNATAYCRGIRAVYPTRFLAHTAFPIISDHPAFPNIEFGTNCDAVMPSAYWADIFGTNDAVMMVATLNTEWRSLAGRTHRQRHQCDQAHCAHWPGVITPWTAWWTARRYLPL